MTHKLRVACRLLAVAAALVVPSTGWTDDSKSRRNFETKGERDGGERERAHDFGRDRDDDEVRPQDLSARWWQWMLSIPRTASPLLDETGEKCMVGQRGPIWFLAGTIAGGTASRACTVPLGKTIFFPVSNIMQANTPGDCGQADTLTLSATDMRAGLASIIDQIKAKTVTIDGIAVHGVARVRSVPFAVTLPADNLFLDGCASQTPPGQRAGVFSPAVDDGYYVKIEGLQAGRHILQFTADGLFPQNVTYELNVVPGSLR